MCIIGHIPTEILGQASSIIVASFYFVFIINFAVVTILLHSVHHHNICHYDYCRHRFYCHYTTSDFWLWNPANVITKNFCYHHPTSQLLPPPPSPQNIIAFATTAQYHHHTTATLLLLLLLIAPTGTVTNDTHISCSRRLHGGDTGECCCIEETYNTEEEEEA